MKRLFFISLVLFGFFLCHSSLGHAATCTPNHSTDASQNVTRIQKCINDLVSPGGGSTGGTVNLISATFTVNAPITLKSHVTIQGQGASTVLKWTGQFSPTPYFLGYSGSGDVRDVTIKDLKMLGQDKDVMCIYFDGTGNHPVQKITVRNVIINNCGQYGIHMKQTDGIFIRDVSLNHNGHYPGDTGGPGGGPGGGDERNHGIYLRDTSDVLIESVTSTNNAANGINVSNSEDVVISGTTTNDNYQHGIRSEANNRFRITSSTAIGNDDDGFQIHPEDDVYNSNICIENSTSRYNNRGLFLAFTNPYQLIANNISNNTNGNIVQVAISTPSQSGVCGSVPADPYAWPFTR